MPPMRHARRRTPLMFLMPPFFSMPPPPIDFHITPLFADYIISVYFIFFMPFPDASDFY
jgi:hypothetical protein